MTMKTKRSAVTALVGIQLGYQTAVLIIANIANCITLPLQHYIDGDNENEVQYPLWLDTGCY